MINAFATKKSKILKDRSCFTVSILGGFVKSVSAIMIKMLKDIYTILSSTSNFGLNNAKMTQRFKVKNSKICKKIDIS